ncbi:MAG: MerR family transcriptional regulator [Anaerolineae bacterium]|nr:MerR family transcriptional regulator [Anaerolineae bacterium]
MTDRTEEATLTIGQFGRLSQLSRKALRLCDDCGLLTPVRIVPESGYRSGYRYYTRAQVARARRIRLLRLIQGHVTAVEKQLTAVQLAARRGD